MTYKHMKRCLTLFREMQIKTSEITLHTRWSTYSHKPQKVTRLGDLYFLASKLYRKATVTKDVQKLEFSDIVDGNVKW